MRREKRSAALRRDQVMVLLATLATAWGLSAGLGPATVGLLALVVPLGGFLVEGRLTGRGAGAACVVLALGSTLVRPAPGLIPWADLALLGGLALAALVVGSRVDRLEAPRPATAADGGCWMTVVVECQGRADTEGEPAVIPKVPPRIDPERRSLGRLAGNRRPGRRVVRSWS